MTQSLSWKIWGRPIKPVAFALVVSLITIAWAAFADIGVLDGHWLADALGGASVAVAITFIMGWVGNSQKTVEYALLAAFWIWTCRFFLVLFIGKNGAVSESLWLSLGWAIVAGGSFLLERTQTLMSHQGR